MAVLGMILIGIAAIIFIFARIWFLIVAFQEDKLWGIGIIASGGIVDIPFLILHWAEAKKPFLVQLACLPILFCGLFLKAKAELSATGLTVRSEPTVAAAAASLPAENPVQPKAANQPTPVPLNLTAPAPLGTQLSQAAGAPVRQVLTGPTPARPAEQPELRAASNSNPIQSSTSIVALAPSRPPNENIEPPPASAPVIPVTIDLADIGKDDDSVLRNLKFRIANNSTRAVREIKMSLTYFDKTGTKLKEWSTTHSEPDQIVGPNATNEFSHPAYFMPRYSAAVKVRLQRARFADGSEWNPAKP